MQRKQQQQEFDGVIVPVPAAATPTPTTFTSPPISELRHQTSDRTLNELPYIEQSIVL